MWALEKSKAKPGLELVEKAKPSICENEVLIQPLKSAICGTDVHIYKWDKWAQETLTLPLTIGHEFVGRITEVGSQVSQLQKGDLVCGEGHVTCGQCAQCRSGQRHLCRKTQGLGIHFDGCFAEFFKLPAYNVIKLPSSIPLSTAAILDPIGNAVHTSLECKIVGKDILISGAGAIGHIATLIALGCGANRVVITDVNEYRLNLLPLNNRLYRVNLTKHSLEAWLKSNSQLNLKFESLFEVSGHPDAFPTLIHHASHGAKIAVLGICPEKIPLELNTIVFHALNIQGIYGRKIFETWYQSLALIQSGLNFSSIITHEIDYKQFDEAFDLCLKGQCGKIIMNMNMNNE